MLSVCGTTKQTFYRLTFGRGDLKTAQLFWSDKNFTKTGRFRHCALRDEGPAVFTCQLWSLSRTNTHAHLHKCFIRLLAEYLLRSSIYQKRHCDWPQANPVATAWSGLKFARMHLHTWSSGSISTFQTQTSRYILSNWWIREPFKRLLAKVRGNRAQLYFDALTHGIRKHLGDEWIKTQASSLRKREQKYQPLHHELLSLDLNFFFSDVCMEEQFVNESKHYVCQTGE